MNPFEGEVCGRGHPQSLDNTRMYNTWLFGGDVEVRLACLTCRGAQGKRRTGTGKGRGTAGKRGRQHRFEDIEDMLDTGERFARIVERSGYAHWRSMRNSLRKGGRIDLIKRMSEKLERDE